MLPDCCLSDTLYGSFLMEAWTGGPSWATHIQGLFKTHVLGARGNGGLKALQVTAKNGILALSINLGNYPCKKTTSNVQLQNLSWK